MKRSLRLASLARSKKAPAQVATIGFESELAFAPTPPRPGDVSFESELGFAQNSIEQKIDKRTGPVIAEVPNPTTMSFWYTLTHYPAFPGVAPKLKSAVLPNSASKEVTKPNTMTFWHVLTHYPAFPGLAAKMFDALLPAQGIFAQGFLSAILFGSCGIALASFLSEKESKKALEAGKTGPATLIPAAAKADNATPLVEAKANDLSVATFQAASTPSSQSGPTAQPSVNIADETHKMQATLLSTFATFVDQPRYSDATITIGEEQFKIHRVVLSSVPFFNEAFFGNFVHRAINGLKIDGIEPHIFRHVLNVIYTGDYAATWSLQVPENVEAVLQAARRFKMGALEQVAMQRLLQLTDSGQLLVEKPEALGKWMSLAMHCELPQLKETCLSYVRAHPDEVFFNTHVLALRDSDPDIYRALVQAAVTKS